MTHWSRHKLVCWLVLAFQCFFLNVVVPGHTRGVILLSGHCAVRSLADLGCPLCQPESQTGAGGKKSSPARPDGSGGCAICHLAMRMTIAVSVDLRLGELGILYTLCPARGTAARPICLPPLPWTRGPPSL